MSDAVKPEVDTRYQKLIDTLWGDKSALGSSVRKKAKELFPDITLPEEPAEAVVEPLKGEIGELKTQLSSALERIAAREKADTDMKAESELSAKLFSAAKEYGLTDAGRDKMISRMKETGNFTDAQAAAAWVVSQTPKPQPTNTPSWMPEAANLFGSNQKDERFESLHRDPVKYLDNELREFVRDPEKYTAETFGTA